MPIGLIRSNTLYFVHPDHLNRPESVTNASKAIVWRAENYAFDRKVVTNTIGTNGYNLGFPGQYYDAENDTWYNYWRNYDASTGKYLQTDPIGINGGSNTFSYASANPINKIDPRGLADFFTLVDVDLTGWTGVEFSFGGVIDSDNWRDSGYYFSFSPFSQGANVGASIGGGFVCRDIEGKGGAFDINAGAVSPTILFDDKGVNGVSLGYGRGQGLSGSVGTTWTFTLGTIFGWFE